MSIKTTGKGKASRIIHDKDFRILQGVFHTEKFSDLEKKMLKELSHSGCPLPSGRFASAKEYYEWLQKAREKSVDPYNFIKKILTSFGLDPKNRTYQLSLAWKMFFGKDTAPIKFLSRIRQNPEGLWVKIEPWTKKKDLEDFWPTITHFQKELTGYRGKEKPWETFERDFQVYILYLEVEKETDEGIVRDPRGSKSIYANVANHPKFGYISDKYNLDEDNLPGIISRCNKYFGQLNLL